MKLKNLLIASFFLVQGISFGQTAGDYAIQGIPFSSVSISDQFWLPKIEINRTVTIPTSFKKCEETVISREWKQGDVIEYVLPMNIHRVQANGNVEVDKNRVAIERGPIVYCVEGADNKDIFGNLILPDDIALTACFDKNKLNGISQITGEGVVFSASADGKNIESKKQSFTAIPYYAWCNRGINKMQIWFPRKVSQITVQP